MPVIRKEHSSQHWDKNVTRFSYVFEAVRVSFCLIKKENRVFVMLYVT